MSVGVRLSAGTAAIAVAVLLASSDLAQVASAQSKNSPIDLVQTSCVVPGKVKAGQKFRVMDEVENAGTEFAVESVTYFYLSANNQIDNQDIVIGGRRVPSLNPRQTNSYPSMVLMPAAVPPGDYFLIAKANADGRLEERYLDNNTVATKITVQEPEKK
jgi:uncharacterized membrane protein